MAIVFFSIGSNQGDRSQNLKTSIIKLVERLGTLRSKSSVYESEPWGYLDQHQYLNQVVSLDSDMMPLNILEVALDIEAQMGRVRSGSKGYEARILDIDLLFYDNLVFQTLTLTLPHPRMHLRNFVLVPLLEIAPETIHPVLRQSVLTLRNECNDKAQINIFEEV